MSVFMLFMLFGRLDFSSGAVLLRSLSHLFRITALLVFGHPVGAYGHFSPTLRNLSAQPTPFEGSSKPTN